MPNLKTLVLSAAALAAGASFVTAAHAHHSFSIFNMEQTKVVTGVVTRVNPDANHLQIFFAEMNPERTNVVRNADGEPIIWAVEMAGSAASAEQGISVNTFPAGTVFSVGMHPLRNGDPAGSREGAMVKCPMGDNGRPQPPAAGQHCDSVEGHEVLGGAALAQPRS